MAAVRQRKKASAEEVAGLLKVMSTSGGRDKEDYTSTGPTVSQLLERVESKEEETTIDPTFSGNMFKKGYRFGNLLACCPSCCGCGPVWKRRFFIIRGGYLFRFTSNNRTARPKGTPVPLSDAIVNVVEVDENEDENPALLLSVSTLRKEYIFRADTEEKRNVWIRKLNLAKHLSIKVSLGHAKQSSVDRRARKAGERLYNDGIRRERQALDHEAEMRNLGGMGGY
jgi:hypothetical protein